jgi:signal transduction histidine kinase
LLHLLEPFYSVRPGSRPPGVGLGLRISHAIIDSHGGSIHAESDGIGAGSRFILRLPAFGAGESSRSDASTGAGSARLQELI